MNKEIRQIDTSFLTIQELSFLDFCKKQHGDQKRKYTNEPYWYHLVDVARKLKEYNLGEILIPVALGHDLYEDTEASEKSVSDELIRCGYSIFDKEFIVGGIDVLTDEFTKDKYPNLNRAKRKKKEVQRLSVIDAYFQTVKYCDLIDNMSSITKHDIEFARTYIYEKSEILKQMNKGYFNLYVNACAVLFECQQVIKQK